MIESDFNIFNSEMEGGESEINVETSSAYVNSSDMDSSDSDIDSSKLDMDSDMIGGMVDMQTVMAGTAALAILFNNYQDKNDYLKDIVVLSTRILANMIKLIKENNFYKSFDAERKFLSSYNENMGKFLINQTLMDLNKRKELKNILNINIIAIIEIKELINKNSPELMNNIKISKVIAELLEKLPKL
tara:strand:- start:3406 stop:3969 length:564 start_codon:yes stop_codon:yes gene_type:complete